MTLKISFLCRNQRVIQWVKCTHVTLISVLPQAEIIRRHLRTRSVSLSQKIDCLPVRGRRIRLQEGEWLGHRHSMQTNRDELGNNYPLSECHLKGALKKQQFKCWSFQFAELKNSWWDLQHSELWAAWTVTRLGSSGLTENRVKWIIWTER